VYNGKKKKTTEKKKKKRMDMAREQHMRRMMAIALHAQAAFSLPPFWRSVDLESDYT
jgi:hypothetical protein